MSLIIGFLTAVLVLTCLFLVLLVLIQLPKKEAGAGVAFGGGTTEALFGAGSGNALTKITKYTATFFIVLSLLLGWLNMQRAQQGSTGLQEELRRQQEQSGTQAPAPAPGSEAPLAPIPMDTSSVPAFPSTEEPATNTLLPIEIPVTPADEVPVPEPEQPAPPATQPD